MTNKSKFIQGLKDGVPIGLGYFAVALSLGIIARNSGLNAIEGFVASILTSASAGEYAIFTLMGQHASYFQIAIMIFIANARYLLMSCALGQKLKPETSTLKRMGMGLGVTDEIFGISVSQNPYLNPVYMYGAMISAIIPWALGTSCGILVGEILPTSIVNALGVALYGMFIAIIVPPSKENRKIFIIVVTSFVLSYIASIVLKNISSGTRIIILTVVIASIFSLIWPIKEDQ